MQTTADAPVAAPQPAPMAVRPSPSVAQRVLRWLTAPVRLLGHLWPRRLTAAEKNEAEARRRLKLALKAKYRQLDREAKSYSRIISRTLANHGVAAIEKIKGEREVRRYVRFAGKYKANEERIFFKVDTRPGKLPFGIGLDRLEDPEIIRLLSINCRHRVSTIWSDINGFWIVVDRVGGIGGLPTHVQFDEIQAMRPANARPLAIPLGVAGGGEFMWKSFDIFQNLLVAGTIGSGKSRFLHSAICTLIRHNPNPDKLKFMMVDLKAGVEFSMFWKLPHVLKIKWLKAKKRRKAKPVVEAAETEDDEELQDVEEAEAEAEPDISDVPEVTEEDDGFEETNTPLRPAICERREEVPAMLAWLKREGERRLRTLRRLGLRNIGQYNQTGQYMPHIFLFIDEWGDVKAGPGGAECEMILVNILQRFRAAGIHVVVCTQTPKKEVLGQLVRNNMPARVIFQMPDVHASSLLVGNYAAAEITNSGRGFWVYGNKAVEIQTPYISDEKIESLVNAIVIGNGQLPLLTNKHDVTLQEILKWSVDENAGNLDYRSVYEKFKPRKLSQLDARKICSALEKQEFDVEGVRYQVVPASLNPSLPRRLMPINEPTISVPTP